jgi:hypothetical protein
VKIAKQNTHELQIRNQNGRITATCLEIWPSCALRERPAHCQVQVGSLDRRLRPLPCCRPSSCLGPSIPVQANIFPDHYQLQSYVSTLRARAPALMLRSVRPLELGAAVCPLRSCESRSVRRSASSFFSSSSLLRISF